MRLIISLIFTLFLSSSWALSFKEIALIPGPVKMEKDIGEIKLGKGIKLSVTSDELKELADKFSKDLKKQFSFSPMGKQKIILSLIQNKQLGQEGYELRLNSQGIKILGNTKNGVFYGTQTLMQLIHQARNLSEGTIVLPALKIVDYPRFEWRGMHLDVARHFFPKENVKKFIDVMALYKFNKFHWHLTEDQGWRIEIKKYPKLTEIGSVRRSTPIPWRRSVGDNKPHSGFYTQEEIKEVVQYAKDRFITIIPEIEMPGHATAAIASYPELGNTGINLEVGTTWGVYKSIYNVNENTFDFLQNVLKEVTDLFPGSYLHTGGDEVPKKEWKESPDAQRRMKELGLKNEEELQSWFTKRMSHYLKGLGKKTIVWDEGLEGGIPKDITIMAWRNKKNAIKAAKLGHDVVMALTSHTYFDYYQSKDLKNEPPAIGGYLPLKRVYSFDPVPMELSRNQRKHIKGGQGQLWTEFIPTWKQLEYMAFPRALALSEVLWSPKVGKNFKKFKNRLKKQFLTLSSLGVNYRKLKK